MIKYTIISYIFNNYENIREIEEKSPNAEYILITDDPKLKSKTWKIICNPKVLDKFNNPFDKCFYIRYHSFEFCSTDISITIDHSILIKRNLDKLVEAFLKKNVNFGFCADISTTNEGIRRCIKYFVKHRGYDKRSAFFQMEFLDKIGYNKSGGIEAFLIIRKKSEQQKNLDDHVWNAICKSGVNGHVDRLDQTILTLFAFNYDNDEMFIFDRHIVYSSYLQWYIHKSNKEFPYDKKLNNKKGFLFNNKIILPYLIE